ncbi:MAG TPA: hypothetical protein VFE96_01070 [Candidatus Bathyarchaeia archaeon]|jgi:hypothetical protein|nr:hypothetical protein [Candidatus Bathyarchaeia archaeon]
MDEEKIRQLANEEVVGQRLDGLFFEGRVEESDGILSVVEVDGGVGKIPLEQVRWVVRAYRYC